MKLPNSVFDTLKWCVLVFIPAATTLYVALGAIWGAPFLYTEEVAKTSAAVCTFLGCLLGISNMAYKKDNDIIVVPKEDEPKTYD